MKAILLLSVSLASLSAFASEKICETKDQKGAIHCEKGMIWGKNCKFFIATDEDPDGKAMKDPVDNSKDFAVSSDAKRLEITCKYLKRQASVDSDVRTCVVSLTTNLVPSCGRIDSGRMDGTIKVEDMPEELDQN